KEVAEIPVAVEDEVWKSSITGTGMHDIVFTVNIFTSVEKINLSPANFNGIENVEEIADSDAFRYIAGISYDYDYAAAVLLNEMNQAGFNDAVVIALSNGKIIPVLKAVIMTKDKFPER
ncbi:MAG: hypothetical protein HYY40_08325, partial [Bacteroidetes bacterium]|nr:hypothetical protein [Bacteroidota bacterium]